MNEHDTDPPGRFVVCIDHGGYASELLIRKLYEVLPDRDAERHGHFRVIDESGEDYLYPKCLFAALPDIVKADPRLALCVRNDEVPVSLELRKLYEVIPDSNAERLEMIRVIDESEEDYLFPRDYFHVFSASPRE